MHYFCCADFLGSEDTKQEALKSFRHYGFVVITDVFDQDQVSSLLHLYDKISELRHKEKLPRYSSHLMPHTWDERIADLAKNSRLVKCTELLLGGRIDLLHSQITFKQPQDAGFSIHQDNYYNKANPSDAMTAVWIALDDADSENGALEVYPFSHRYGAFPVKKDWPYLARRLLPIGMQWLRGKFGLEAKGYLRMSGVIERFADAIVPAELKPMTVDIKSGSVGFMHGDLLHKSGVNSSQDRFRRNLLFNYIRQGAKFNPGIFARRSPFQVYD